MQWEFGSGAGSKMQWEFGIGAGSKTQWEFGIGAGSKTHWEFGSGRTFNNSPFIDLCLGILSDGGSPPYFCMVYPNLLEML